MRNTILSLTTTPPLPPRCRSREYGEAVERYTAALAYQPDQAALFANRAAALIKLQRWRDAEAIVQAALRSRAALWDAVLLRV